MKILHHHHRAEIAPNRLSTLTQVEVEVVVQAKDKVVVVLTKIKTSNNKISLMMDKGPMYVEEEIREEGGVQEEEVDGNRNKKIILMNVGFVVDMVTMQMIVIIGLITEDQVVKINKEIMHLHQTMTVMGVYLLCSI